MFRTYITLLFYLFFCNNNDRKVKEPLLYDHAIIV